MKIQSNKLISSTSGLKKVMCGITILKKMAGVYLQERESLSSHVGLTVIQQGTLR